MIEMGRLQSILEELAPPELAESYDPLVYLRKSRGEFEKIGVCVDPTEYNIQSASKQGVQLLLTHHRWEGEAAEEVEENNIGLFQMHSAWNRAPDGIIATLARILNLEDPCFEKDTVYGMIDMTLKELIGCCQRIFEVNIMPYVGDLNSRVRKVAVLSGPGFLPVYKEEWDRWIEQGCEVALSSEIGRYAVGYLSRHGIKLIDLGHSVMARPGMRHLTYILQNRLKIYQCQVEFFKDIYSANYHIGSFYPGLEIPEFLEDKEET